MLVTRSALVAAITVCVALAPAGSAWAQPGGPAPSQEQPAAGPAQPPPPPAIVAPAPPQHKFAITISPIHLALPVLELAGELRLDDKLSVAAIVGGGRVDIEDTAGNTVDDIGVFEIGGHVRYYALGDFEHGMQVGAELLYINAQAESGNVQAVANGAAVGPFIGYKFTAEIGFTVDIQGGVEFVVIGAEDNVGNQDDNSDVIPLVNVNVGWAF